MDGDPSARCHPIEMATSNFCLRIGFSLATIVLVASADQIYPNDPRIEWTGAAFAKTSTELVEFCRFSDACLVSTESYFKVANAKTTTGVVIRFTTTSAKVTARFRVLPGENRGSRFGIRQNGRLITEKSFSKTESNPALEILSEAPGTAVTYEILMPIFSNCGLTGLDVSDSTLIANPVRTRPVYAAIGDSITHGTGQTATAETYPWLLSNRMGWTLNNLAVGGARVSPSVGNDLKGRKIDVITIMLGFNDWNIVNDPAVYRANYSALLEHIRMHQADATIFCITPLPSSRTKSPGANVVTSLEPYREVVRRLVESRISTGDRRLHLIEGPSVATIADLSKDGTHLSVTGAAHVADSLEAAIKKLHSAELQLKPIRRGP